LSCCLVRDSFNSVFGWQKNYEPSRQNSDFEKKSLSGEEETFEAEVRDAAGGVSSEVPEGIPEGIKPEKLETTA